MTTVRQLLTKTLQKAGIVTKNESPSSDEMSDAVDALNMYLGHLSNDGLVIYNKTTESFTLSSTSEYTIGSGGTLNTTRPTKILSAFVRVGGVDYPLREISLQAYNEISFKDISGIPDVYNYTPNYPLGLVKIFPKPSAAYTLFVTSEKPLTTLSVDDTVSFPTGWEMMLIYNLAVIIAPEYGQPFDQSIYQIAKETLGSIKRNNARNAPLMNDSFVKTKNIYTGY